ncbi:hypothetical protein [Corynebacterium casei]|uniref:hypothetical protein n=1 Tax=Corynebacterium casei TaxID=160386 RepID=UPI003FD0A757
MATTAPYTPPSMTVSKTNIARASRYNDIDSLIEARADLATARIAREITTAITKGAHLNAERMDYLKALLAKAGA